LLRYGRHFRLDSNTKIVIGRSKSDNDNIMNLYVSKTDIMIRHSFLPGPDLLIPSGASDALVQKAAAMCAGYTKTKPGELADMKIKSKHGKWILRVAALSPHKFRALMI
jgi:predicted ribosome quality control (RQC) complex YloA/Tae2 family protein